ncbi:MAG: SRPBCC domain-containing protein [Jatrophihabitantaceae bacterium]
MQLEHSFTVPIGVDEAWTVLLNIERIAPCMPGAAIDSVDGDNFTGTVKVKLGPIGLTYKGKASFIEKDVSTHRAVIDARGRDARGNGTANAKVTATLTDVGGSTRVDVITDLDITGKPAQFGRGVMVDVGNKLIGQFAECLAGKLTEGTPDPEPPTEASSAVPVEDKAVAESAATAGPAVAQPAVTRPGVAHPTARHSSADVEPINLIESAGPAVAKRLAPVAVAVLILLLATRRYRTRRSR